jgi:hypothetical protein
MRRSSALAALLLGCASGSAPPAAELHASPATSRGYALLYALMSQEKQLSRLLAIKSERDDFGALVQDIADTCERAHARLEELAEADPSLDLENTGLPPAEIDARKGIQSARTKQLLAASGEEFEIQLALMQNEALTYASHLTEVLARAEPDETRLEFARALWSELHDLQARLWTLIRSRYHWIPPD